jgi:formylglycine-generating enzyme required for sulfatase activity
MTREQSRSQATQSDQRTIDVRIFIASPGDVGYERDLAREVIEQMRGERAFRGRVNLQSIAWDQPGMDVAMQATLTPQEAIKQGLPTPSQCNIVVVILWSRIGTRLPDDFLKPDGSRYLSGTEWEYLDAVDGCRKTGAPSVWLYRRDQVPNPDFEDPDYEEKKTQWGQVKVFFSSLVNDDDSIKGGVNSYQAPDDFRRLFEQHLRDQLTGLLVTAGNHEGRAEPTTDEAPPQPPQWTDDPYPGLDAFVAEQAPIFFGRGRETDQLLQLLSDPKVRFIAVVGASGSGKSSLVAAGLMPRLQAGALPHSDQWIPLYFKPGERGNDPFLALAYPLKAALGATGVREQDLANELSGDAEALAKRINELLDKHPDGSELLLVIDQFEEFFTLVEPDLCQRFLDQLAGLVKLPGVRVVVTLRADFYPRAMEVPALTELLRGQGTFPLSTPGVGALHEMITRPALAAGLELEDGLTEHILDETGTEAGALSLMAFALYRLYEQDKNTGCLSLNEYHAIGGVAGAIRQRAEDALKRVGSDAESDKALDYIFEKLIEVDKHEVATRSRATRTEIGSGQRENRLVDALIEARLLVSDNGDAESGTVEVAHEAVLTKWPRLQKWIEAHASELRAKRDLDRAAKEWREAGKPKWNGLPSGSIVKRYRKAPSPTALASEYLDACARLQRVRLSLVSMVAMVLLAVTAFGGWMNHHGMTLKTASQVLMVRTGFENLPRPDMERIPAGDFLMGSDPATDPDMYGNERPIHLVKVNDFYMGKNEVTFDEYDAFVESTGRRVPDDKEWRRGRRPVINVAWDDAVAYAKWLSLMTGKKYRLPTEAEWEYTARAVSRTRYWWGDEIDQNDMVWANCHDCGSQWDNNETAPAGQFPANAFGLHDTAGNVSEWVQDCWHNSYEGANRPDDGSAWEAADDGDCDMRVIRGGSWFFEPGKLRSAYRYWNFAVYGNVYLGFRLARDIED